MRLQGTLSTYWEVVYPDPAKGQFQLYHVVPEGVEDVQISIKDALGREVFGKDLTTQGGVAEIACPTATGLHFLSLYYDGILMETLKLNLIK